MTEIENPDVIRSGVGAFSQSPRWLSTNRPPYPLPGLFGYATDTSRFEFYDGTWRNPLWTSGGAITGNLTISGTLAVTGASQFTGTLSVGTAAAAVSTMAMNSAAGVNRNFFYRTANVARWSMTASNVAESGNNAGSTFLLSSYTDAGAFKTVLMDASRTSGLFGTGDGHFQALAPFTQVRPRAIGPGGTFGNDRNWGDTPDIQPAATLAASPLSVTNGSPTVTVTWAGACVAAGPIGDGTYEVYVEITGAAAVGGITPSGWLKVQSRPTANTFTVTWTSNATSDATGGGSAVVVRTVFATVAEKLFSVTNSPAGDFAVQRSSLFVANPVDTVSQYTSYYQQNWSVAYSPNDPTGADLWNFVHHEVDLGNRGDDEGYFPFLYQAARSTIGMWMGAWPSVYSWAPGGGACANWNTVYSVFSGLGAVGVYTGFSVQPLALVAQANDPSGHGGVGVDLFGSWLAIQANGFATVNGTTTVTITGWKAGMATMVNGDTVYLPLIQTVRGVTFGGAEYVVANVNTTTGKFDITGTGAASSTGVGGAKTAFVLNRLVPYAPLQFWGGYKHGIKTTEFRSESGFIIETQPGNGIQWDNGTSAATINTAGSGSNLDIALTPSGTGAVKFGTRTASADVPVTGYIEIKDAGGTLRRLAVVG